MGAVEILLAWLAIGIIGAVGMGWWSRRLWKRRNELSTWSKGIAMVAALAATLGAFGTVVGLVKAFGAIGGESVDPSRKARILAEGISEAMNCTAFGILVWIPSAIALLLLTRRRRTEPR